MEKLILIILLLAYSFCKIDKVEDNINFLEKYGEIDVGRGLGMIYLNVEDFDLDEELILEFSPTDSIEENYLRYDFTDSPPQNLYMNLTYYSTHKDTYYGDTYEYKNDYDYDYYTFTKKENKKFMVVRFTATWNVVHIKHSNETLDLIVAIIGLGILGLLILFGIGYCIYDCCKKKY